MLWAVSKSIGASRKRNVHLGVEDAGRRLNDAGGAAVGLDLEDLALAIADNSEKIKLDILRLHVEKELEGKVLRLSSRDADIVAHSGQIAEDASHGRSIFGQGLSGRQHPSNEGNGNRLVIEVLHLDNGLGSAAIDKLHAEDVRVGECRSNVNLELGSLGGGGQVIWLM